MKKFHLWPEEITVTDGLATISVTRENPDGTRQQLWYRFPQKYQNWITPSCDPFLVAMIFKFMSYPGDVMVHSQLSPSLLSNLTEYQAIWHSWRPHQFQPIEISAEKEQESPAAEFPDYAIAPFSGGLESCFTMYRHCQGLCGRWQRPLKAGLMVHGFEINLENQQLFAQAAQKSQRMLDSLGVELIPMATNFRKLEDNWVDTFSVATLSCLMLFKKRYGIGLIPSSEPYQALLRIHGSHPVTDNLCSSESFAIIHDGAAFTGVEKIEQLAQWPEFLQELQVCCQMPQAGGNCGRCWKCLRTILGFRALGLEVPAALGRGISNQEIIRLVLQRLKPDQVNNLKSILATAKARNISEPWVKILELCLLGNSALSFMKRI